MDTASTGLTTDWLAARLGVQPARVEALRRAGELLGIRRADGTHTFPSWQFGKDGRPLPLLARLIGAARAAGIHDEKLHELVSHRIDRLGRNRYGTDLASVPDEQLLRHLVWRAS